MKCFDVIWQISFSFSSFRKLKPFPWLADDWSSPVHRASLVSPTITGCEGVSLYSWICTTTLWHLHRDGWEGDWAFVSTMCVSECVCTVFICVWLDDESFFTVAAPWARQWWVKWISIQREKAMPPLILFFCSYSSQAAFRPPVVRMLSLKAHSCFWELIIAWQELSQLNQMQCLLINQIAICSKTSSCV